MLKIYRKVYNIFIALRRWSFDNNEKNFIKNRVRSSINYSTINGVILIQCVNDYFYYSLFSNVIKKESELNLYSFHGISGNLFKLNQQHSYLWLFYKIYSIINFHIINRKWKILYGVIGIKKIHTLDSINFFNKLIFLRRAIKIWLKLKTKSELINLCYDDILIGDLIYDTYLRYRVSPTVYMDDPFLCYYIYSALKSVESSEKILHNVKVAKYFCSYATYIHHGIPIRVFLKHKIEVFSAGNVQQLFKKLDTTDFLQTSNHINYYNMFLQLANKDKHLKRARKILESKFNGNIDTSISYMRKSSFNRHDNTTPIHKFDGVLFLHDFFDSPHIYKRLLFNDFYEWVIHTLELVISHDLKIAVKPHPNQIAESKDVLDKLKLKYNNVAWLDADLSNNIIFNSGIKFGISVYGTVLHELAYFGINPICAGDNPHYSFDFIHKPKNIQEYNYLILNFMDLEMPSNYKELVEMFFYMHNLQKKESYFFEESYFQYKNRTYTSNCLKYI